MRRHFPGSFARKTTLAWVVCASAAQAAGIPVIDTGNLLQSQRNYVELMAQTLKQIEQYKIMARNAQVSPENVWNRGHVSIDQLQAAMQKLNQYRQQVGGLEAQLRKFKDVEGYRSSGCVRDGCTAEQWSQVTQEQGRRAGQTQKIANEALLRSLDQQYRTMASDVDRLQRLQEGARGALGNMQALGAANQLAVHQAHQLQQIRALLMAQNTAVAARQQVQADREALAYAAQEAAVAPRLGKTPNPLNWLSIKR